MDESPGTEADRHGPRVDATSPWELVARLQRRNAELSEQLEVARARAGATERTLALLGHPALVPPLAGDSSEYFMTVARAIVESLAEGCVIDAATSEGLACLVAAHREPEREAELRDPARRNLSGIGEGALLRLPLGVREVPLGVMTVWSAAGTTIEPSGLALLNWVARHFSVLLEQRRLQRAAEEAARASDTLISMVSHELRTPLATISMSLDTSSRRIQESADHFPKAWLLQRLQKARRAVQRTDRLIHMFLGVSQIQTGRLEPDVQEVDVAALVSAVASQLADDLAWAGCRCHVHAPRPERGSWDPAQLEVVFNNLLTNAIKYASGSRVDVIVDGDPEHVTLSVSDTGPGIPPEHQARLFQRFARAPTGPRVHGFGLGLWIVKHFVEANGGVVRLSSEMGKGTRFEVRLPRRGG